MKNLTEAKRRMMDAEDCLRTAQELFLAKLYRGCVQNSQSCVELCAKAVISIFSEPDWTHDPGRQLQAILKSHKAEFDKVVSEELIRLAQNATELAPWHGKTTYGEEMQGEFVPAVELCTEEKAEWALGKAKIAFDVANKFLTRWFEAGRQD